MENLTQEERLIRQHALIDPRFADATGIVYGLGMLGSWTAHALARIVQGLTVWDGELVEAANLGTQAYDENVIGDWKAIALYSTLNGFGVFPEEEEFPPEPESWAAEMLRPDFVVACADSFRARAAGAKWCIEQEPVPLFIDTRARGLECTIVTADGLHELEDYVHTLPRDEDVSDVPCGEVGTAFVGMFVASRVCSLLNTYFAHGSRSIAARETWHVPSATIIELSTNVAGKGVVHHV